MGILDISLDMALVVSRDYQALHGTVAVDLYGEKVAGTLEHISHHQGSGHSPAESGRGDRAGIVGLAGFLGQVAGSDRKRADLGIRCDRTNHIIFVFTHKKFSFPLKNKN
jgi:hypothetical protein